MAPHSNLPSLAAPALRKHWTDLLRRVYKVDPLGAPKCSARMAVIGFITQSATIKRILAPLFSRGPGFSPVSESDD